MPCQIMHTFPSHTIPTSKGQLPTQGLPPFSVCLRQVQPQSTPCPLLETFVQMATAHHGILDGFLSLFTSENLIHLHLLVLVLWKSSTYGICQNVTATGCPTFVRLIWDITGCILRYLHVLYSPSYSLQRTCTAPRRKMMCCLELSTNISRQV